MTALVLDCCKSEKASMVVLHSQRKCTFWKELKGEACGSLIIAIGILRSLQVCLDNLLLYSIVSDSVVSWLFNLQDLRGYKAF